MNARRTASRALSAPDAYNEQIKAEHARLRAAIHARLRADILAARPTWSPDALARIVRSHGIAGDEGLHDILVAIRRADDLDFRFQTITTGGAR